MIRTMIERHWKGTAHAAKANDFLMHLQLETVPVLEKITGFINAKVLTRTVDKGVEIMVVTTWESVEAIKEFAGANAESAVVALAVKPFFIDFDLRVQHFKVELQTRTASQW